MKKELYQCKKCNQYYTRAVDSKLKPNKCECCILSEAWSVFINETAKTLKLYILLKWLNKILTKQGR
jgi:hypothetical protein